MILSRKTLTAFAVLVVALSLSAASGFAAPALATARATLAVGIIRRAPLQVAQWAFRAQQMRGRVRIRHDRTSFPHAGGRFQICPLGPPLRRRCHVQGEADLVTSVRGARFVAGPVSVARPVGTKSIAAAGSYSAGGNSDYDGFSFFVSPGGTSIGTSRLILAPPVRRQVRSPGLPDRHPQRGDRGRMVRSRAARPTDGVLHNADAKSTTSLPGI